MRRIAARDLKWRRLIPVAIAAALSAAYVIASPPSLDLAAHLFRAQLFGREPFGIWNNYWYSGHHIVGYSLLFPAASWLLTPQIAAALAATATAALFEPLARRHFGEDSWLGATVFGAATAVNLFTGRLAFAFGALPAMAAIVAIDRRRTWLACGLAFITAFCSPVAAVFVALAGVAYAVGRAWPPRRAAVALPGAAMAACALVPVGAMAIAFPEGGTEPFVFNAFLPIPLMGVAALLAIGRRRPVLAAGVALYTLGTIASYLIPSAIGSNAGRLGVWAAAPLAALLWWHPERRSEAQRDPEAQRHPERRSEAQRFGPGGHGEPVSSEAGPLVGSEPPSPAARHPTRRREPLWRRPMALLALVAAPLLYLQWHDPIRDLTTASSDPSNSVGYYRPLLKFLHRQGGPPFRVEIPFTSFHWEAYAVASHFAIARGWERQLDIKDNSLFYSGKLTPGRYQRWLHADAVRFVAMANAPLDYAGRTEARLIAKGLPYLKPVMHDAHWRVYAVRDPTPIAQGKGVLTAMGPDWVRLYVKRPGEVMLRVHFTPYWAITRGSGCVEPDGAFTRLLIRRSGPVTLGIDFSLRRIHATSPRCT